VTLSLLFSFIGLCVLLSITPGPDSFLVLRFSIVDARPGIAAAIGSALGARHCGGGGVVPSRKKAR
jgi:threonine/homoserine/homoserine lactone efflux protein